MVRLRSLRFEQLIGLIETAEPRWPPVQEVALYQAWIAVAGGSSPLLFAAWFNLGVALTRNNDRANAITAYRNALVLKPSFHAAAINLGLALESGGNPQEALQIWESALQPVSDRIALLTQRARLLERCGRLAEAEAILRELLLLDPEQADVVHHWVHIRQKTCLWPAASPLPGLPHESLLRGSGPLGILALTDDIDTQRENALRWIMRKTTPTQTRLSPPGGYWHERIRIGYMSSDFCRHAMSYLITELFERHDRTKFEIFGYCNSADDGSDLRHRVISAFDHYRPIRDLPDEAAAHLIRDDEIDILIDLNGITDGTRLQVLRSRPAPVQATYLGFIGAIPLPELDYLLCDDFVIPPERAASYRPAPLSIGDVYQANDTRRGIGTHLSRADVGLPEDRFVFCCFSNHYKITPDLFAAWMSILQRSPRAMLWLTADNEWSEANLVARAAAAGVDADRLVIAPRTGPDAYMSRLALGDLFLDTFPYNAGTIASDAIRMGLPLITLAGRSFASRMAGSLLHAIGADEGIATTLDGYIEHAVTLANDAETYAAFRSRFSPAIWSATIGDIDRFTRQIEAALERVVLR